LAGFSSWEESDSYFSSVRDRGRGGRMLIVISSRQEHSFYQILHRRFDEAHHAGRWVLQK